MAITNFVHMGYRINDLTEEVIGHLGSKSAVLLKVIVELTTFDTLKNKSAVNIYWLTVFLFNCAIFNYMMKLNNIRVS